MINTGVTRITALLCLAVAGFPLVSLAEPADLSLPTLNGSSSVQINTKITGPLTLEQALTVALASNPNLEKINALALALAEVPSQVGTLPDPMLSLNALNVPVDTYSFSQEGMTQTQIGISFELPFPGKLALREQAASFIAKAAAFDVDEKRLVLTKNVQLNWWNLAFLDRAISIVKRNQVLLRQLIKIAEVKYKTGKGLQADVLLAQVELSKLLDIEISLRATRQTQAAMLNALLDRPAASQVILPTQVDERLPVIPDIASFRQVALDTRPVLSAQRSAIEASRSRVALAHKDYYPDFKLGAAYGFRDGINQDGSQRADMASVMLSMTLPIFTDTKQDRALAQRNVEVIKEEYELQDRTLQVDVEIEQALAEYRGSHEQASLFKTGIIPQAQQTTASMLAAYQVSKMDFLNLIRAQITLYNYETQYWKALTSGWQAWARLEAAVGTTIPKSMQRGITINNYKESPHE
ncbi:TolC family protein [Pseudomonas sp. ANT_H14]|nr:TolC family protein [Pseudomonas sp. ANT_H14]KAA0946388.1 TolC family protein [Pseudomonas sp. ANT_H4]